MPARGARTTCAASPTAAILRPRNAGPPCAASAMDFAPRTPTRGRPTGRAEAGTLAARNAIGAAIRPYSLTQFCKRGLLPKAAEASRHVSAASNGRTAFRTRPAFTATRVRGRAAVLVITKGQTRAMDARKRAYGSPGDARYVRSVAPGCKFREYRLWSRRAGSMNRAWERSR